MRTVHLVLLFLALSTNCFSQAGFLDLSFSDDGRWRKDVQGRNDRALTVTVAPNGDVITAGTTGDPFGSEVLLTRLDAFGIPVMSFGDTGIVRTSFGPFNFGSGRAIALQPDERIIVAGQHATAVNQDDFVVLRYHPDGSPDTTFGDHGKRVTSFSVGNDAANAVVIQPDGYVVAAGFTPVGFALARYDASGTPDASFGVNGKVTTPFNGNGAVITALALLPDGSFLAAGSANGAGRDFAIAKYLANGSLDASFGTTGQVVTSLGAGNDEASSISMLPDRRFYVAGYSHQSIDMFALVRYLPDGTLDTGFNGDGILTMPVGPAPSRARTMALQSDGRIVLAGSYNIAFNTDFALMRADSTGALDNTFGTDGVTFTDFDGRNDIAYASCLQSNGELVVAGASADSIADVAIARYHMSGQIGIAEQSLAPGQVVVHPDPLTASSQVRFTLPTATRVTIDLLDASGRVLCTWEPGLVQAGTHTMAVAPPSDPSPGLYVIRLNTAAARTCVRVLKD